MDEGLSTFDNTGSVRYRRAGAGRRCFSAAQARPRDADLLLGRILLARRTRISRQPSLPDPLLIQSAVSFAPLTVTVSRKLSLLQSANSVPLEPTANDRPLCQEKTWGGSVSDVDVKYQERSDPFGAWPQHRDGRSTPTRSRQDVDVLANLIPKAESRGVGVLVGHHSWRIHRQGSKFVVHRRISSGLERRCNIRALVYPAFDNSAAPSLKAACSIRHLTE